LAVRLDGVGDVLITGPAVRALAAHYDEVVLLAGPRGRAGGELLPGVGRIVEWAAPWIEPEPAAVDPEHVSTLVKSLESVNGIDAAFIFTSYHQSPLPLALLLRLAGVPWIGAISDDYPGSLLDLRHRVHGDPPEAERALSLVQAAGLPAEDSRLQVRGLPEKSPVSGDYVAVHPGTSVPARAWPPDHHAELVRLLSERTQVVVTGAPDERDLTARVAGPYGIDLGGRTTLAEMGAVLRDARVLVAGNTGPAHLAAAVGTPVVSLFAPTVPAARWAPHGVPRVVLGDQNAPCAGSRARECPVPGHPCLGSVTPDQVLWEALRLTAEGPR